MTECCCSTNSMDFLGMALIHSVWLFAILGVFVELLMARVGSARHRCLLATIGVIMMPVLLGLAYFGVQFSLLPFRQPGFVAGASLTTWLAFAFLVGVALQLFRLVVCFGCVARLRRSARTDALLMLPQHSDGLSNFDIRTVRSNAIAGPVTLGWLRPLILIPEHTVVNLDASQLALLVRHELAHVRNRDYLWNLLQCVAESLVFYHPVVWLMGRAARHEREFACDDCVVQTGVCRLEYSRALAALEHLRSRWNPLFQHSSGAPLLPRIQRLLQGRRGRLLSVFRLLFGVLIAAFGVIWTGVATTAAGASIDGPGSPEFRALADHWQLHAGCEVVPGQHPAIVLPPVMVMPTCCPD